MPFRIFVENHPISQKMYLYFRIQRGKILKFEQLWEFWDIEKSLQPSESGAHMELIDAEKVYMGLSLYSKGTFKWW